MLLADSFSNPSFSWNLVTDWNEMTQYAYMRHAFAAAAVVALLGGVIGWFAILRSETYATHTLSLVGFPGASGAALVGLPALAGYFVFCVAGAFAIPALTGRSTGAGSRESAAVGSVQALALAFGLLFVSLDHSFLNGINTFLFGTFTGITADDVWVLLAIAIAALAVTSVIHRRLLFASVDPGTAQASGIHVRGMDVTFLILLGLTVAEISQFTGALLAFTLVITPAAIAQQLTPQPIRAMLIAIGAGVIFAWFGLTAAYFTSYPVGFYVTSAAVGTYLIVRVIKR